MEGPSVILQGPAVVSVCWDARLCLSPSPTSLTCSAGSPPPPSPTSGLWGGEGPGSLSPHCPSVSAYGGGGAEGGGEGDGDGHLAVALHPLTCLPRPQPLTPLLGGANTRPRACHSCLHLFNNLVTFRSSADASSTPSGEGPGYFLAIQKAAAMSFQGVFHHGTLGP